jgi:hypothetical protein
MTRARNPSDINSKREPPFLIYEEIETTNKKIDRIKIAI